MRSPINHDFLQPLDLFGAGLSKHAMTIKYELLDPDLSILCFRTIGLDGNEYFFALLSYDHLYTIKHAKKLISKNFAKVIEFIAPLQKQKGRTELEQKHIFLDSGKSYLLARTARPSGSGYWASYITIRPGDSIDEKLEHLNPEDKQQARKIIVSVLQRNRAASNSATPTDFLAGWQAKENRAHLTEEAITVNDTNIIMNIYRNIVGGWEAFYNYADRKRSN